VCRRAAGDGEPVGFATRARKARGVWTRPLRAILKAHKIIRKNGITTRVRYARVCLSRVIFGLPPFNFTPSPASAIEIRQFVNER
jgi:hypothetical protein